MHLSPARLASGARRLLRETRALAVMEFALAMPPVMAIGGYGIELSNLALTNLRISQYALNLADIASRVGLDSGLATVQLREADVNDVLQGVKLSGQPLDLTTNGRVTLSSLEGQSDGSQLLHWQRCIGKRGGTGDAGYDSTYGTTTGAAGTSVTGMGDDGAVVKSPANSGVMFVEINYAYQPLFGTLYVSSRKIHYTASFIVRDKRDFSQLYTSPGVTPSTCDQHNA